MDDSGPFVVLLGLFFETVFIVFVFVFVVVVVVFVFVIFYRVFDIHDASGFDLVEAVEQFSFSGVEGLLVEFA